MTQLSDMDKQNIKETQCHELLTRVFICLIMLLVFCITK